MGDNQCRGIHWNLATLLQKWGNPGNIGDLRCMLRTRYCGCTWDSSGCRSTVYGPEIIGFVFGALMAA